ncbi:MAG: gluconokinase [Candidatus Melainabacteria bacterium]|nr:gluconokinase [Candidatus Melainabacteria bacterium]
MLNKQILIIMGVSGCGKSAVAESLSKTLAIEYQDADWFHPPANKEKMRRGIALTDEDRKPWLEALRQLIVASLRAEKSLVLACSALKASYRDLLVRPEDPAVFVYLKATPAVIASRLAAREHEYMNPALLESQLSTLEEPEGALTVDADRTLAEVVREIVESLS